MLLAGLVDGAGGTKVGEVAATLAAAHFLAAFVEDQSPIEGASNLQAVLEAAFARTDAQICEIFNRASGPSLTAFALTHHWFVAVHAGNNRLYRMPPGFTELTRDDAVADFRGTEPPDQRGAPPGQFVGVGASALPQNTDLPADAPKRILLTSDGLQGLGPRGLRRLVRGPWSEERLKADEDYWQLPDNASAVYVRTRAARTQLDWSIPYELRLICGQRRTSFTLGQAPAGDLPVSLIDLAVAVEVADQGHGLGGARCGLAGQVRQLLLHGALWSPPGVARLWL
jgi:serine/threonine protein phosphatase PrpC